MEVLIQNFAFLDWQMLVMWAIGGTLIYLAIVKELHCIPPAATYD